MTTTVEIAAPRPAPITFGRRALDVALSSAGLVCSAPLWALGFLAFHVTSGLIHLLLVIALIVIVARLVTGRRPVV